MQNQQYLSISNPLAALFWSLSICAVCIVAVTSTDANAAADPTSLVNFETPTDWQLAQDGETLTFMSPDDRVRIVLMPLDAGGSDEDTALSTWHSLDESVELSVVGASPKLGYNGWQHFNVIGLRAPRSAANEYFASIMQQGSLRFGLFISGPSDAWDKHGAAVIAFGRSLRPADQSLEEALQQTTADRAPSPLTPAHIAALKQFIESAVNELSIPGLAFAVVQGDQIVYEGGIGHTVAGGPPVNEHTLFMGGLTTQSMTTLLLAKLVERNLMNWDDPVVKHYPAFRLGDDSATQTTTMRDLACHCTNLDIDPMRPVHASRVGESAQRVFDELAATNVSRPFGETYLLDQRMMAIAGYVAGHIAFPEMELTAAYQRAMQTYVLDPLNMDDTTFSIEVALDQTRQPLAMPHTLSLDSEQTEMTLTPTQGRSHETTAYLPASGVWTSAGDLARFVRNEMRAGRKPDAVGMPSILERRRPLVTRDASSRHGLGLVVTQLNGVRSVNSIGVLPGYSAMWKVITDADVGVVVLANSTQGASVLRHIGRRLTELLYDVESRAWQGVLNEARSLNEWRASLSASITVPPDPVTVASLARKYVNPDLGELHVNLDQETPMVSAGVWRSRIGTTRFEDGSRGIVMLDEQLLGGGMILNWVDGKRALSARSGSNVHLFVEAD